jgi:predicted ArsR family transcriptional regulator
MMDNNKTLKNQSQIRVLSKIPAGEKISWNELNKKTKLNKNTLSHRLAELRHDGYLNETIERSGSRGRPQLVYTIVEGKRNEVRKKIKPVKAIYELEDMYEDLASRYELATPAKASDKVPMDSLEALTKIVLAIIQSTILRTAEKPDNVNILAPEAVAAIGRILAVAIRSSKPSSRARRKIKKEIESTKREVANLAERYLLVESGKV